LGVNAARSERRPYKGLRITIDIFSGRPDPFWNIEDNDQVRLLQLAARNRAALAEPTSGYTGLAGPVTVLPLPAGRSRLGVIGLWIANRLLRFAVRRAAPCVLPSGGGFRSE